MAAQTSHRPKKIYTEEKAIHLVNVFIAVLSMMFLLAWQQLFVLNPLKKAKKEMALLDPSEIIATPFPMQNVASFTIFPVAIMLIFWLVRAPQKFLSNIVSLTKLSLVTFAMFALCGNNMITHWQLSSCSAVYIGALLASTSTGKISSNILEELPFRDFSNILASCRLYCLILFVIPFQVLSVLDHGSQVQRWPLPVLLGGTYGYVIGTMIGLMLLYYNPPKSKKEKQ